MNLKRVVLLVLALACGACATTDQGSQPSPAHRFGSVVSANQWRSPLNPVTGNSQTILIWDGTGMTSTQPIERVTVSCFFDQTVTILFQVRQIGSATWRTMNGNGSGEPCTANVGTAYDYLLLGPDNRIQAVTGGTGPSVSEVSIGLIFSRALAM